MTPLQTDPLSEADLPHFDPDRLRLHRLRVRGLIRRITAGYGDPPEEHPAGFEYLVRQVQSARVPLSYQDPRKQGTEKGERATPVLHVCQGPDPA